MRSTSLHQCPSRGSIQGRVNAECGRAGQFEKMARVQPGCHPGRGATGGYGSVTSTSGEISISAKSMNGPGTCSHHELVAAGVSALITAANAGTKVRGSSAMASKISLLLAPLMKVRTR